MGPLSGGNAVDASVCSKCTKVVDTPGNGDGSSQGSCLDDTHKCFDDGACKECQDDTQCTGNSNKCDTDTRFKKASDFSAV